MYIAEGYGWLFERFSKTFSAHFFGGKSCLLYGVVMADFDPILSSCSHIPFLDGHLAIFSDLHSCLKILHQRSSAYGNTCSAHDVFLVVAYEDGAILVTDDAYRQVPVFGERPLCSAISFRSFSNERIASAFRTLNVGVYGGTNVDIGIALGMVRNLSSEPFWGSLSLLGYECDWSYPFDTLRALDSFSEVSMYTKICASFSAQDIVTLLSRGCAVIVQVPCNTFLPMEPRGGKPMVRSCDHACTVLFIKSTSGCVFMIDEQGLHDVGEIGVFGLEWSLSDCAEGDYGFIIGVGF